ncbi:MAG: thioredoxin family protein [Bacteroidota bacterium]
MQQLKSIKKAAIALMIVFVSIMSFNGYSQMITPVKWAYSVKQTNADEADLVFTAKIDKGWHLYSQFLKSGGPLPTLFVFDKDNSYKLIGKATEPKPKVEHDDMFNMDVQYFDVKAVFVQKVKVLSKKDFIIKVKVDAQSCNDETCVPVKDDGEFKIKGNPKGDEVAVKEEKKDTNKTVSKTNDTSKAVANANDTSKNNNQKVSKPEEKKEKSSLWLFFWASFGSGLLGLLMPCVFPMIPMTVSFFMKSGSKGKIQALIFGTSIVVLFIIFGTILALAFGPNFANMMSTHWLPNLLFALIFIIFAISLFGYFEIVLPSWLINKSVENEEKGDYVGPIFMAITLVLVSFSCTLPIVSNVAISSIGGEFIRPIVSMFGFSLAFAIPFTMFAFFPSWLKSMPKSGGWLNSVKVVLAFVELAFALKFINVPDQTYHWRLLDREIYLAAWIVIASMLGFYLLGKLKFPHDDDMPVQKSWFRLFLAIVTFTFVVYMIPGMWGAPLSKLSGWLPPESTQDFELDDQIRDISSNSTTTVNLCSDARYGEELKLPQGLHGYFDYDQALASSKKQNKPVFVDFTGHGCTNCRKMEAQVWSDPRVLKKLKEDFVVVALYVDDKVIALDKQDYIKDKDGKDITMLGEKNAYIQTTKFASNAQPWYQILNSDGTPLVEPRAANYDLEAFVKFLDDGIAGYKKSNSK